MEVHYRTLLFSSRIIDTKWGGKTESVQMTLNVEQVLCCGVVFV